MSALQRSSTMMPPLALNERNNRIDFVVPRDGTEFVIKTIEIVQCWSPVKMVSYLSKLFA